MKKWFSRLFWIPLLIVAVLFLVANRQRVAISLDPFSPDAPAVATWPMPLWFWLIAMLFVGFAMGALGMWLSGRERRQKARDDRRTVKMLRRELADERRRRAEIVAPPLLETTNAT